MISTEMIYRETSDGNFKPDTDCVILTKFGAGLISGIIVATLFWCFIFKCENMELKRDNVIIPKTKLNGQYLQLDNGKLYKRQ